LTSFRETLISDLKGTIPEPLLKLLPGGYKRTGHIGILNLKPELNQHAKSICEAALRATTNVESFAVSQALIGGEFRKPSIKIEAGKMETETIHRENNCLFKFDAARIMFSSGNHFERARMVEETLPGEKILDMFCCVGNLSMPVAVSVKNVHVTGIEKNPVAYEYLGKTIALNKVRDKFTAILGDNREILLKARHFDRIIMGYFTVDDEQLLVALQAVKPGGTLHVHDVPQWNDVSMKERMNKLIEETGISSCINNLSSRHVKWIAEKTEHVVHDVTL